MLGRGQYPVDSRTPTAHAFGYLSNNSRPVDAWLSSQYRRKLNCVSTELTMTRKTLRRVDLYKAVERSVGLSRVESAAIVEQVIKEITECLERGETVKLASFGNFVVRKKGPRMGRNPTTGKQVPIPPRRITMFKPSPFMKQLVNSAGRPNRGQQAEEAPESQD
jgi:integration host factor subunit alpha